jgi:hypothetical protein
VLKKKRWKGLVGQPCDRGKCGIYFLFFIFRTVFLSFFFFFVILFIFLFLTVINLLMFVPVRKDCC